MSAPSGGWFSGVISSVSSGDSVAVVGKAAQEARACAAAIPEARSDRRLCAQGSQAPEKTLTLAGVLAPRLVSSCACFLLRSG